jgi:hypothetical protein
MPGKARPMQASEPNSHSTAFNRIPRSPFAEV